MRRKYLLRWLAMQPGYTVRVANGLVRVEKGEHLMYLRSHWYYPKFYVRIILRLHKELWEPEKTWKQAYHSLVTHKRTYNG